MLDGRTYSLLRIRKKTVQHFQTCCSRWCRLLWICGWQEKCQPNLGWAAICGHVTRMDAMAFRCVDEVLVTGHITRTSPRPEACELRCRRWWWTTANTQGEVICDHRIMSSRWAKIRESGENRRTITSDTLFRPWYVPMNRRHDVASRRGSKPLTFFRLYYASPGTNQRLKYSRRRVALLNLFQKVCFFFFYRTNLTIIS